MTNIKQVLAFNIKNYRNRLGLTQAKLAEKSGASTQYLAMIELGRKFPSLEMLDRIAAALEIDNLALFTPPPYPVMNLENFKKSFISDMEKEVSKSTGKAIEKAVKNVLGKYIMKDNQ